jgi:hypothetical protein
MEPLCLYCKFMARFAAWFVLDIAAGNCRSSVTPTRPNCCEVGQQ